MKSFVEYLTKSQKTYEFRIKFADIDPDEKADQLENALNAYGLESLSKAKRLPIKDNDIDFPSRKNCQVYLVDAVLSYPVTEEQLRGIIAERAGIPAASLFIVPKNHPEETWRWNDNGESELHEYKKGEAVLDKEELEDNPDGKQAAEAYSKVSFIASLQKSPEWNIAKEQGEAAAKDSNSLPQNTTSPIKGK